MKTTRNYTAFGTTIPAGSDAIDTDSCAVIVRYDETKGHCFDPKAKYMRPRHGLPIAVPRSYVENDETLPI